MSVERLKAIVLGLAVFWAGCGAPDLKIIDGPFVESRGPNEVVVVWQTEKPGDSRVEYGLTSRLGTQVEDRTSVTDHRVVLAGLRPGRTYYYRALSGGSQVDGSFVAGLSFSRGPYTQHVADSTATVMWGFNSAVPARVRVWTESGEDTSIVSEGETRVRLTGLRPGTRYRYRVVAEGVSSEAGAFRTSAPGDTSLTFLLYGDSRGNPAMHARLAEQMISHDFDFVFHTGDFVNDGRQVTEWEPQFFEPVRPIMLKAPLYPALGNHENDAAPYYAYFEVPPNGSSQRPEAWYSFDYGHAHFVVLDSNPQFGDLAEGTEQRRWLEQDLAASKARWKFAVLHHPLYSSGVHKSNLRLRKILMPIFERFGIDMILTGHDHCYERTWPLWGGQRSDDGIVHLVSGGGGAVLYDVDRSAWTAVSESLHHYCILRVVGSRLDLEVYDVNGRQVDALRLFKEASGVEGLITALAPSGDVEAIRALGLTGQMKAVEPIVPFVNSADPSVREAATEALARIGAQACFDPLKGLSRDVSSEIRRWATWGLSNIGGEEVAVVLRDRLGDPDAEIQRLAAVGLRRSPLQAAGPDLIEASEVAVPDVRREAVRALVKMEGARIEEAIVAALRDEDGAVRRAALDGVVSKRLQNLAVDALAHMLSQSTEETRILVIETLGASNSDRAIGPLVLQLKNDPIKVRRMATIALGRLKRPGAIEALIDALEDQDRGVRTFAWRALRAITGQRLSEQADAWRRWFADKKPE
ncbi:MAG: HEAT repeat domain-containing protein [bacterium]|nr:HEAT repeat domain-containing protein [bacterium]